VLRITDGRTGEPVELTSPLLRVRCHLSGGVTDLRVLLVDDLVLRAMEMDGGQVLHAVDDPTLLDREVLNELGIHPPGAPADLGGPPDVDIYRDAPADGIGIQVGSVATDLDLADLLADPQAVRFAMLSHRHREPIALTPLALDEARQTLGRWRLLVAQWANSPSAAVPPEIQREAKAALADDLDTPAVIDMLRRVEADDAMADGAKFETFVLLDRFLAVELPREIGYV